MPISPRPNMPTRVSAVARGSMRWRHLLSACAAAKKETVRCCISTWSTANCAISPDSVGSTKRISGMCLGKSGSSRKPSTPAPSENTAFRFGSEASRPGGGRKLTAYAISAGS
ncbi:MAG: hypothetical protein WDM81_09885 [Rhizomicrobium sp.]